MLTYVRQSTSDIYVKLNIAALFHDLETEKEKRKKQVQTTEIYVDFNVCNMLLFFWPINKMCVETAYVQLEERPGPLC